MPAKKKEAKPEEPAFTDGVGTLIHESEGARYTGGVRRYPANPGADGVRPSTHAVFSTHSKNSTHSALSSGAEVSHLGGPGQGGRGVRHGQGIYASPQIRYEGDWVDDKMEGQGHLFFLQSGSSYEGGFRDGCFDGKGIYCWADGSRYDGEWRHNRMHGSGVYIDEDGQVFKGVFYSGTGPGLKRIYTKTPQTASDPSACACK
ncbi:unnamed protein product [Phytomonas sp. Hart1]|nr:unnamed protein product [Phytomonas sp. Hart1]|eukprot:CCW71408.1 unnamed protein product [Phytomonas sp. isolate Hart1]